MSFSSVGMIKGIYIYIWIRMKVVPDPFSSVRYQLNHYNTKHMQRDRAWYTCTMQDTLRGWKYSRIQRSDLAQNNHELTILNIRKFEFLISNTYATIEYFVEFFMINVI